MAGSCWSGISSWRGSHHGGYTVTCIGLHFRRIGPAIRARNPRSAPAQTKRERRLKLRQAPGSRKRAQNYAREDQACRRNLLRLVGARRRERILRRTETQRKMKEREGTQCGLGQKRGDGSLTPSMRVSHGCWAESWGPDANGGASYRRRQRRMHVRK
eukprot:3442409-Pleurochrysis_carterae.AAC.2